MRMTKRDVASFIGVMLAIAAMLSVFIAYRSLNAGASSMFTNNINAILTIQPTCYTTVAPNAINFGSVTPGTASGAVTATVSDGNGNVDSFPWISGGDWSVGGAAPTFYVTNTLYYNGISAIYIALTSTPTNTFALVKPTATAVSNVLTFEVTVPAGTSADTFNQLIIITDSC